jgi:exosome complex protein LRP1
MSEAQELNLPEEAATSVAQMSEAVRELETSLLPLLALPPTDINERLNEQDRAKLRLFTAYSINSLFYAYLKSQGEATTAHPVMKELDRVKEYFGKLRDATQNTKVKKSIPKSRIDKDAAQRFVKHGTSGRSDSFIRRDDSHGGARPNLENRDAKKSKEKDRKKHKSKDKSEEGGRSAHKRKSDEHDRKDGKPSKRPKHDDS